MGRFFKLWYLILASLLLVAPVSLSAPTKNKEAKVSTKSKKTTKKATGKAAATPKSSGKAAKGTKGKANKAVVGKGSKAVKPIKADVAKKPVKKMVKLAEPAKVTPPTSPDADLDASFGEDSTSSGPWLVVFVLFVVGCVAYFLKKHHKNASASRENFHRTSTHEGPLSSSMKSLMPEKSGQVTNPPQGLGAKLKGFFASKGPGSQVPSAFGHEEDMTEVGGFSSQPASALTKTQPPKSRAG